MLATQLGQVPFSPPGLEEKEGLFEASCEWRRAGCAKAAKEASPEPEDKHDVM
jgi:hypothetical protein